jgi:hypothetical protein
MENSKQLTTSALIDAYHNEPVLWDTARNANEEEKELAWTLLSTAVAQAIFVKQQAITASYKFPLHSPFSQKA